MELKKIYEDVIENGFCICKGIVSSNEYQKVREESIRLFSKNVCKHKTLPKALRGNIGAGMRDVLGSSQTRNWNIYRACFFPWNEIDKELSNTITLSRRLSMIRNQIIGLDPYAGTKISEDGFIQYTSLSLYPKNGGFLHRHYDGHPKDSKTKLIHFKIELTHKFKDYKEGGFYVWDNSGKEIDISAIAQPTDVIFFNGENHHEIKPIEGEEGRIALFEIPTFVTEESRFSDYTGEGESKIIKAKRKFKNTIRRGLSNF